MNVNTKLNQPCIPSHCNRFKSNCNEPVGLKQDRYDGECASDRIGYSLLAGAIGAGFSWPTQETQLLQMS